MTNTGNRIMNRTTKATHKETGITVIVDNYDIPITEKGRSHLQQRDIAINILSEKLGVNVDRDKCEFEFLIEEVK